MSAFTSRSEAAAAAEDALIHMKGGGWSAQPYEIPSTPGQWIFVLWNDRVQVVGDTQGRGFRALVSAWEGADWRTHWEDYWVPSFLTSYPHGATPTGAVEATIKGMSDEMVLLMKNKNWPKAKRLMKLLPEVKKTIGGAA
jgi:hypothetical protein